MPRKKRKRVQPKPRSKPRRGRAFWLDRLLGFLGILGSVASAAYLGAWRMDALPADWRPPREFRSWESAWVDRVWLGHPVDAGLWFDAVSVALHFGIAIGLLTSRRWALVLWMATGIFYAVAGHDFCCSPCLIAYVIARFVGFGPKPT